MAQHQRLTGPSAVNDAAPFTSSMTDGQMPSRSRAWLAPRIPLPLAQPTHVAALQDVAMVAGNVPSIRRPNNPLTRGGMVAPPEIIVFDSAMVQGSYPDRFRERLPLRLGLQLAQTTHTDAAFSVEMVQGQIPFSPRPARPLGFGLPILPPDVLDFSIEMVQTARPWSPRLFLAPKIALPLDQVNHQPAPISVEMLAGYHPDLPRTFIPPHTGWQSSQTTPVDAPFSLEMVQGWLPVSPHLWLPLRYNGLTNPPTIDAFSPEMVQGWLPAAARQFLAPRIPLPISQTTHQPAPFSQEMVAGSAPAPQGVWVLKRQAVGVDAAAVFVATPFAGNNIIFVDGRLAVRLAGLVYTFLD